MIAFDVPALSVCASPRRRPDGVGTAQSMRMTDAQAMLVDAFVMPFLRAISADVLTRLQYDRDLREKP
jgi:hypothetical protein